MNIKSDIALSDSGFVFNPASGESYTVNPIGVEIIQLLKDGKSIAEVSELILENYNTDLITIDKDLNDFIVMLKQYSLVDNNDQAKAHNSCYGLKRD